MAIEFTTSQFNALGALCSSQNVFLTGEAGSGKSFLIEHYMKDLNKKTFPILASTGAAAVIIGGRTFHSFMGLGIMEGGVDKTVERALKDKRVVNRIRKIKGFVLDEISMISEETFRAAEKICRLARNKDLEPWGGLRVIAVGDFAQLPPVQKRGLRKWIFQSDVWENSHFRVVQLKQNMRTSNNDFLKVLNSIRVGEVSEGVKDFLNERCLDPGEDFEGTRLFPRRFQAEKFNQSRLEKIDKKSIYFESSYTGAKRFVDILKKVSPLKEQIEVKEGALVMLKTNDPKQRWVNGSTGIIIGMSDGDLKVELLNGRMVNIERVTLSLYSPEGEVVASVTNFPIELAYATTIHKSQGMTLDTLYVDLSNLWEPGQAYVALSRVIDPDKLFIKSWTPSSIKADENVNRWYEDTV